MTKTRAAIAAIVVAASLCPAEARQPDRLRSLQIRTSINDGDDFVFVEPVGADVRVRAIRVASANEDCHLPLVQAVERIVPRTTVAEVAGMAVCNLSSRRVDRALADALSSYATIDFLGSLYAVVAGCDGTDAELVIGMPPMIDRARLMRQAPDVAALWQLGSRLQSVAFDRRAPIGDPFDDPFSSGSPDARAAREALGTAMVPVLLSSTFEDYLRSTSLASYRRPPAVRQPSWIEVVDRAALKLVEYVEPVMPPIAMSARLYGYIDVRLRVDASSGMVNEVELVPGASPLTSAPVVEAVRRWRGLLPTRFLESLST